MWQGAWGVAGAARTYRFVFRCGPVPHLHLYAHPLCPKDITFFHFKHFCEFNEIFNFYARQMDKEVGRDGGADRVSPLPLLQLLTLPLPLASSCAPRPWRWSCLSVGLTSRRDMLHLLCILGGQLSTKINNTPPRPYPCFLPITPPPRGSILFVVAQKVELALGLLLYCTVDCSLDCGHLGMRGGVLPFRWPSHEGYIDARL